MKYPAPTRADHQKFCLIEGWQRVSRASGGKTNHHVTYTLHLDDGRILRTRISHPPSKRSTYGATMWSHILRDQLDVTLDAFWNCVRDGELPARSTVPPALDNIPLDLYRLLTGAAGLPETAVRSMTREEAIAAAAAYWSRPAPDQ